VHVGRYCGLYEQAIAAHAEARRLDPNVATSIEQTVLMTGDVERLLALPQSRWGGGGSGDTAIRVIGLGLAGRREQARTTLDELLKTPGARIPAFLTWTAYLLAWLERRVDGMQLRTEALRGLKITEDPEAMFQEGWLLCDVGDHQQGLPYLQRAVAKGYSVAPTLEKAPQFDALRGEPAFQTLLRDAQAGRDKALAAFRDAGGERLLG
jgi:hypothetical protein